MIPAEKGYKTILSLEKPGRSFVDFQIRDPPKKNARAVLKNKQRAAGTGIIPDPGSRKTEACPDRLYKMLSAAGDAWHSAAIGEAVWRFLSDRNAEKYSSSS